MSEPAGTLARLGCVATARRIAAGELDAVERLEATLEAIAERDGDVGAFLEVHAERARERARAIDADPDSRRLPLAGVPVAVKDNICVAGGRTTAGSRILEGWTAPYDATAVGRLRRAGALIVGKTNLDEFGMGSSTERSALGDTRNPRSPDRVPGGSSGGSAAAVAAGMVPGALGSDTGGSVRQPAAFCGIAGIKPTYGRVSRHGLVAFASSLDCIGSMAAGIDDAMALLAVIAGRDERDATTADAPAPGPPGDDPGADGLRIGVIDLDDESVEPGVRDAVEAAVEALAAAGAERRDLRLPHREHALAAYTILATAEASSNLSRYDGVRYGRRAREADEIGELYRRSRSEGLGPEVKRRILLGTYVLVAGHRQELYERALRARTLVARDFRAAFGEVDLVVGPTTPTTAFRRGDRLGDPLEMYRSDLFTVAASLAGLPAASVPCGTDPDGLPVGLQIVGPAFGETRVVQLARAVERLGS